MLCLFTFSVVGNAPIELGPTQLMPSEILRRFQGRRSTSMYWHLFPVHYRRFASGIKHLLKKRNIKQMIQENVGGKVIIEDPSEHYVGICQKCKHANAWLYNNSCWSNLYQVMSVLHFSLLLPGRLSRTMSGTRALDTYVVKQNFHHDLLTDMLAERNDPTNGSWDPHQWVCGWCIVAFVRKGLLGWLVSRLTKDGHAFKENCRYGHNCRKRVRSKTHDERWNHLCEPLD